MERSNQDRIKEAMMQWENVSLHPHRFGGIEFRMGRRELGHIHGNHLVDIPFPLNIRNEVIQEGKAEEHHILAKSGWVSVYLRKEEDVAAALDLLRRSWELARQAKGSDALSARKSI